jgi:transcription termination factor NusB
MGKSTQVMYQPVHFQGIAERVMKGYDPKDIWLWLASKDHEACKRITRTRNEDIVADIILEKKAEFLRQNQKRFQNQHDAPSTSGKGKGKGKIGISKGGDKGKGKGGKGKVTKAPQIIHVPTIAAFKRADGKPIDRIMYEEMNHDSEGVLVSTLSEYAENILAMDGEHLPNAMAFLLFGKDVKQFMEAGMKFHEYDQKLIKVPMANVKGSSIFEADAILVNVGSQDIVYNQIISKVTAPTNAFTILSYHVIKSLNDPKVFAGTAKHEGFINHVHTTIKQEWLHTTKPIPTCIKTESINGIETISQVGYVFAKPEKVHDILRRSGHNGATIWYKEHDITTTLIPLPRKMVIKEAIEMAKKVGDNSLGLINKNCGTWSVRVLKDDAIINEAKAKLDPSLSAMVGPKLMNMPAAMGCKYVLKGLLSNFTFYDIAKMMKEDFSWNVKPENFLKSNTKYNTMVVTAHGPPPQTIVQINGTSNFIEIEPFVLRKPKTSPVEKIFQAYQNKDLVQEKVTKYEDDYIQPGETEEQYRARFSEVIDEMNCHAGEDDAGRDWYDMSNDEVMNSDPPAENKWANRKANAIREADKKADQEAKDYWKANAVIKAEAEKANDQIKIQFQNELQKSNEDVCKVKSLFEIELEKIKELSQSQNRANEEQVQKLVEQQNASNKHFNEVCEKINVDIAAGMKELYDTINVQIQKQNKQFHLANVATQESIAEVQGKFVGIEKTLAAILAGQAKIKNSRGSDDDHEAKKARGSDA